jgi:hypothetical protein
MMSKTNKCTVNYHELKGGQNEIGKVESRSLGSAVYWLFKRPRHVPLRDRPRHFEIRYMVQLHNELRTSESKRESKRRRNNFVST